MISVVVPILNEEQSLEFLHAELDRAFSSLGVVEFLFIDDGSRDGSWTVISDLSQRDSRIRALRFRRNFGKAAALSAGFKAAHGDLIFTLDADLQDDPAEAQRFLMKHEEGFDVVSGWKQFRHDPWHKVWPSRLFNWAVSRLTGCRLHDHNCGFKLYTREVLNEIDIYGELHRFVPVLAFARGFRVAELPVNHRARRHGHSKYGMSRLIKGFLDLLTVRFLTGYGQRPLHPLGVLGLLLSAPGFAGLLYLALVWLRGLGPIGTRPLLGYSTASIVVGVQLICLGILAELITSYHIRNHPPYSVAETIDPQTQSLSTPSSLRIPGDFHLSNPVEPESPHG